MFFLFFFLFFSFLFLSPPTANPRQNIKEGIEGRPVSWYADVFGIVFQDLDRAKASQCKVCEWKKLHDKDASSKKDTDDKDDKDD